MKDNKVLVREENGEIVSMIHRNPYKIYMRGSEAVCDYIVGVSTLVAERHKGYMRSLILAMLRDMQEEQMPFTFLMPARESLYRPYDSGIFMISRAGFSNIIPISTESHAT